MVSGPIGRLVGSGGADKTITGVMADAVSRGKVRGNGCKSVSSGVGVAIPVVVILGGIPHDVGASR